MMFLDGPVVNLTPVELAEHLGVRLQRIGGDLEVRFANGESEHFIPAPADYPINGSKSFITHDGQVFMPLDEGDR